MKHEETGMSFNFLLWIKDLIDGGSNAKINQLRSGTNIINTAASFFSLFFSI